MKRIFIILLICFSLFAYANGVDVETLKQNIEEDPGDYESLSKLLEIYEDVEDYYAYIDTVISVINRIEEPSNKILPFVLQAARYASEQYLDQEELDLYTYFLVNNPNLGVVHEFFSELYYLYLSDDAKKEAMLKIAKSFGDVDNFLEQRYAEYEGMNYTDVTRLLGELLFERGKTEYIIPYITSVLKEENFDEVKKLLNENKEELQDKPDYYFILGIINTYNKDLDSALKNFTYGRSISSGNKFGEYLDLMHYVEVPEYLIDIYDAVITSDSSQTLQNNLQEYVRKHSEIYWISKYLKDLPEPVPISELLSTFDELFLITSFNPDNEKIDLLLLNSEGKRVSRFSNVIYGNFFSDGIIYSSGFEQEKIIFEGATKETWTNYAYFISSPLKNALILINDYDGVLTCLNKDLSVRWDLKVDYQDYNSSWSANGKYFTFCDYDYNFYVVDTLTGTITETFSSDLYYEQVLVRNNGEIYIINSEGKIEGIRPNKPLLTSNEALTASFIDDDTLMYLESVEELFQDIMRVRIHIYSLEDHTDKVIEESMILVPAPITQTVHKDHKIYYTTFEETASEFKYYDVDSGETRTLFTFDQMLLFPDVY
ncbi:MAG: hypothetical protein FXF54_06340 [Kosmotoga sp.]|nr:MAG: hypothetical protein FXF54_06340 [Kosmotoga sp.]